MADKAGNTRRAFLKGVPAAVGISALAGKGSAEGEGPLNVVAVDDSAVNIYDPSDGSLIRSIPHSGAAGAQVAVSEQVEAVFVNTGTDGTNITAYDIETGEELWVNTWHDAEITSMVANAGELYAGSRGSEIIRIDPETGDRVWYVQHGTETFVELASPADTDYMYAVNSFGTVYGIYRSDGSRLYDTDTGISANCFTMNYYAIWVGGEENGSPVLKEIDRSGGGGITTYTLAGDGEVDQVVADNAAPDLGDMYVAVNVSFAPTEIRKYESPYDMTNMLWSRETVDWGAPGLEIDHSRGTVYGSVYNHPLTAYDMADGSTKWDAEALGAITLGQDPPQPDPPERDTGPDGLFALWNNYKAMVAAIVGAYALIGAWSRSLAIAAWSGLTAFLYIAFETQTPLFVNIAIVVLVMVLIGFAFKFNRLELEGEP